MSEGRSGGEAVARALVAAGVESAFMVSGNQILPIIDGAHEARLRTVHMRHETAAVYAAIGCADVLRRPAAALVSAGPGFLASLQGLGVARSMELPVVLLAGASALAQRGRGAFQEIDQRAIAAPLCKATFEPTSASDVGATVAEAVATASEGVPGPVLVSLPADTLTATVDAAAERPAAERLPEPPDSDALAALEKMAARLADAQRPALVVRPSAARSPALELMRARLGVRPIVTESPRGLSDPRYSDALSRLPEADAVLVIGPADFSAGFLNPAQVGDPERVMLIDSDGDPEPAQAPGLRARMDAETAMRFLARLTQGRKRADADWIAALAAQQPSAAPDGDPEDGIHPLALAEAVRGAMSRTDILVLDGGEFCQWVRLGLRNAPNLTLWNGKLGAIGGSIPIALGAAIAAPKRRVIAILGDGSAGYFLSEFETLARLGIKITAVIGNDARWAAEWHMQVARYGPDRTFDTELTPARYDLAAAGFGGSGTLVERRSDLATALADALAAPGAACVNVRVAAVRSPAEVRH